MLVLMVRALKRFILERSDVNLKLYEDSCYLIEYTRATDATFLSSNFQVN